MRKQNREYKRSQEFRDASYFVIVCEGAKTEIQYFENFKTIKQYRVKIRAIAPNENKSSPKWVLDKGVEVVEELDLNENDQIWFVTDKDRWRFEDLNLIETECQKKSNWNFVISNPCFEVWLHAHVQDLENLSEDSSCQNLKKEFNQLKKDSSSTNPLQNVRLAIERAKRTDNSAHFIPDSVRTKVYKLVEELIKRIGNHHFE
jgi:hypothetical protein